MVDKLEVYWIAAGISSPASAGLPLGGWTEGDTVDQVKQWSSYLRRGDLGGLGDPDGQVDQKARVCLGGLSRRYLLSAPDGEKGRARYKSRTLQCLPQSALHWQPACTLEQVLEEECTPGGHQAHKKLRASNIWDSAGCKFIDTHIFLYWGIVDFQYCVHFRCTTKWISYIATLFLGSFSICPLGSIG